MMGDDDIAMNEFLGGMHLARHHAITGTQDLHDVLRN